MSIYRVITSLLLHIFIRMHVHTFTHFTHDITVINSVLSETPKQEKELVVFAKFFLMMLAPLQVHVAHWLTDLVQFVMFVFILELLWDIYECLFESTRMHNLLIFFLGGRKGLLAFHWN